MTTSTAPPSPPPPSVPATGTSTAAQQKPRQINLIRGWPAPRVLPADLLKRSAENALSDPAVFGPGLQYAPDPGFQPLREELARFLSEFYSLSSPFSGEPPDPNRICITGGASQNLACLLASFTDPAFTKAVWAVAPCYHLACPIFEDAGFRGRLKAVPEDEEGIDLEWLEKGLRSIDSSEPAEPTYKTLHPQRKAYRHIIYVVPTSANPSGKTMSLRRREQLVLLAREYNALIISDDVYDFLQWAVASPPPPSNATTTTPSSPPTLTLLPRIPPPPRLVDIDRALAYKLGPSRHEGAGDDPARHFGHAVSNGSFSKIISPGVRTGWAEGTPALAAGLAFTGANKSGGAPSQLSAVLVWDMMRSGALAAHIDGVVRPDLQRRHGRLVGALGRELAGLGVRFLSSSSSSPEGGGTYGGYFVWLTLPGWCPPAGVVAARALREENLVVAPGDMFAVKGDEAAVAFGANIRLCYSWEDEDRIVEGVERLARVIRRLRDDPPGEQEVEDSKAAFGFV